MLFFIIKTLHIVFVMAFVASVFYLPRILINLVDAKDDGAAIQHRLGAMGLKLYKFGHAMFGLALICGLLLWEGFRFAPDLLPQAFAMGKWLHAKLGLVVVLFVYFIWIGRMLKSYVRDAKPLPTTRALRWLNELPVLLLAVIVYLVVAKPF